MENTNHDNEMFIDADAGFSNEKDNYETIILNQINACVKILSREMTGGQVVHKAGPTGVEKYIEDVRELVINHIDALKMLMTNYIKSNNKEQIKLILKEIEDYKEKVGEINTIIPNRGIVKLKNIKGMAVDNPIWKEFIHFKAQKYREMFEILICCYNEQKAHIRELEQE